MYCPVYNLSSRILPKRIAQKMMIADGYIKCTPRAIKRGILNTVSFFRMSARIMPTVNAITLAKKSALKILAELIKDSRSVFVPPKR